MRQINIRCIISLIFLLFFSVSSIIIVHFVFALIDSCKSALCERRFIPLKLQLYLLKIMLKMEQWIERKNEEKKQHVKAIRKKSRWKNKPSGITFENASQEIRNRNSIMITSSSFCISLKSKLCFSLFFSYHFQCKTK